jgi:hypothetical protein
VAASASATVIVDADRVDQPGLGVHLGDEVAHLGQLLGRGVMTRSGPSATTLRSSSVTKVAISTMT